MIGHVAWALNQDVGDPTRKLILIGICEHDGDGGAWPSKATLARYASCTPRTVTRHTNRLAADGWIDVLRNEGGTANTRADKRTNLYVVHYERGVNAEERGVTADTPRGDRAVSPEPTKEPPAKNPARERADEIVKTWWDWHRSEHDSAPTAQPYIACVKIVERLVKTDRWSDAQIKTALRDAPTVSVGALEIVLSRMRPLVENVAPAPSTVAKHPPTRYDPTFSDE